MWFTPFHAGTKVFIASRVVQIEGINGNDKASAKVKGNGFLQNRP